MNSRKTLIAAAMLIVGFPAIAVADGDAEAGKVKFEEDCSRCHYEDDYAEEPEAVIKATIRAIVDGEIKHRGNFADLSDDDIANLAAFLSSQ